ncbi:hypothetical protein D3C78_1381220 [compost metagenome]
MRPACRVKRCRSSDTRWAPRNDCGRRRAGLAVITGNIGNWVPTDSVVLEIFVFSARPSSEYSSLASRVTGLKASSWVPVRSGDESSLMPSSPVASRPKPTVPSVKPELALRMKPCAHSLAAE